MLFANKDNTDDIVIFWDRAVYLGVVFLPLLLYLLGAAIAGVTPPRWRVYSGYLATFFFLIASRTDYFVSGVFRYRWGVHSRAQILHNVFLVFFGIYIIEGINSIRGAYRRAADLKERSRLKYIYYAFLFLFILWSLGYLPGYSIPIYPFGYIVGVLFVIILTYDITRHQLFNAKAVAAEIFVFAVASFFLLQALATTSVQVRVINGGLFVIAITFGTLLIQSVFTEISQREKLEQLTGTLEDLNENLQQKVADQTKEVRKAYEIEKKARIDLEELDKAKDQFILTTQHHLRTPLTIIKGFLETTLLKKEKKLDPETIEYLQKASIASDRMAKLINDFFGISQL